MDKTSYQVNSYLNKLSENGLLSYINIPTRVTEQSSTIIDHIFVNKKNTVNSSNPVSAVIETDITDHYAIFLSINNPTEVEQKMKHEVNFIKRINHEKIEMILAKETWIDVERC